MKETKYMLCFYNPTTGTYEPVKIQSNQSNDIMGLGDILDKFMTAMMKIYHMETKARRKDISHEERGKLTLQIRAVNDGERIKLRNLINQIGGKDYYDVRIK